MYVDWLLNGAPTSPGFENGTEDGRRMRGVIDAAVEKGTAGGKWNVGRVFDELRDAGELGGLDDRERVELRRRFDGITRNDVYRLTRAAEVAMSRSRFGGDGPLFSSERLPSAEEGGGLKFRPFFLCPCSRWDHCRVIDARCEDMIGKGLLTEVGELVTRHGLLDSPVRLAIGYRQTVEYLKKGDTGEGAFRDYLAKFKAATRRYAKQQQQWWRREVSCV